jgi:hypothetical protein
MFKKFCLLCIYFVSVEEVNSLETPLPKFYIVENWFVTHDSLWNIASNPAVFNDPLKWYILYEYNKEKFPEQNNPNYILPGMIIEIPSINNEYREGIYSREILNYAFPDFTRLFWKSSGTIINESIVDDVVTINFDTMNIPGNSKLSISIYEKNTGGKDDIVEIIEILSGNIIMQEWIVEFDEKQCRQCAIEMQQNGYTIPEYYFIVRYGNYISEISNIITIKGWVRGQFYDEDYNITLRNCRVGLILGDGTEIETVSDDNGYIDVRGVPIGEVFYYLKGPVKP